jgi:hypothetical protein
VISGNYFHVTFDLQQRHIRFKIRPHEIKVIVYFYFHSLTQNGVTCKYKQLLTVPKIYISLYVCIYIHFKITTTPLLRATSTEKIICELEVRYVHQGFIGQRGK